MIKTIEEFARAVPVKDVTAPVSRQIGDLWLTVGLQDVTRDGREIVVRWVGVGSWEQASDQFYHIVGDAVIADAPLAKVVDLITQWKI